jgi:hypothetical protein
MHQKDQANFNGLIGSLAGQGVNYAMGGDFTLNVLNLSVFSGGQVSGGLLELHLGKNGTTMNFGTGGANVSFDNLISSFRGSLVWNATNYINNHNEKSDYDLSAAFRGLFSFGKGDQKKIILGYYVGEKRN